MPSLSLAAGILNRQAYVVTWAKYLLRLFLCVVFPELCFKLAERVHSLQTITPTAKQKAARNSYKHSGENEDANEARCKSHVSQRHFVRP